MNPTTTQLCLGDSVFICSEQAGGHLSSEGSGEGKVDIVETQLGEVPSNCHIRTFMLEKVSTWASVPSSTIKETSVPLMFGSLVQLRHRVTDRLVAVYRRRQGRARASYHVQLNPASETDAATVFRVMPRYKIRQEGEKVGPGDHLVFLNDQYKVYLTANGSEVSAGSTPSEFSISCFDNPREAQQSGTLTAGHGMLLFHKEQESFLTGNDNSLNFVHPNIQDSTYNIAKLDYSSNSLWLVENPNPLEGGVVRPSPETYRVKHLASGGYLSVSEHTGGSYLNTEPIPIVSSPADTTLWCFVVCDTRERTISSSSTFFRLLNPATGHWLHALPNVEGKQRTDDGGDDSPHQQSRESEETLRSFGTSVVFTAGPMTSNADWDFGVCLDVQETAKAPKDDIGCDTLSKPAYVDVFCATVVSHSNEKDLHNVLEHATVIKELASRVSSYSNTQELLSKVEDERTLGYTKVALSALIKFCTVSEVDDVMKRLGLPVPKNQRMLLEQKVHLAVLDFIFALYSPNRRRTTKESESLGSSLAFVTLDTDTLSSTPTLLRCVNLAFRFLALLIRNNEPGCEALMPYLDALVRFFEVFPVVSGVLVELCALKEFPFEVVRKLIDTAINNVKEYPREYFQLLCAVSKLKGVPLPSAQTMLMEVFLKHLDLVPHMYQGESGSALAVRTPYSRGTYTLLDSALASKAPQTTDFFSGSWGLLAACNSIRPYHTGSWVSPDQLMAVLRLNENSEVFCAACRLATSYVSGLPFDSKVPRLWFFEDEIERTQLAESPNATRGANVFQTIKDLLLARIQACVVDFESLSASLLVANELLVFWNMIVLRRRYTPELRTVLLEVIDKFLACIPPLKSGGEQTRWTEANVRLMECVNYATNLLQMLLDHSAERAAARVRAEFKKDPSVSFEDFLEQVKECCDDPELSRSEWVSKLFEMARFEHKRLANNVLRCGFRLLAPTYSVLGYLSDLLVFNKKGSSTLLAMVEEVEALATASREEQWGAKAHTESLRELFEIATATGTQKDVQWALFQVNAHELLFSFLDSATFDEAEIPLVQDVIAVLDMYAKGCEVIQDVCVKQIHIILRLSSVPKLFTSKECVGLLSSLFQSPRDILIDLVPAISEYIPPEPSELSEQALRCVSTMVDNTAGGTQTELLAGISSATESYGNILSVGVSDSVLMAFVELLTKCFLRCPSLDFSSSTIPVDAMLARIAKCSDVDTDFTQGLLRATAILYFEGELNAGSSAADAECPHLLDAVIMIADGLKKHKSFSELPSDSIRFLSGVVQYTFPFRQRFAEPIFAGCKQVVELLAMSSPQNLGELETSRWCSSLLRSGEGYLAPAIIPHLTTQRLVLGGILGERESLSPRRSSLGSPTKKEEEEKSNSSQQDEEKEPKELDESDIVSAWRSTVMGLRRSFQDPSPEQLESLMDTIKSTMNEQDGILHVILKHLGDTVLDDWVASGLLVTLTTILDAAKDESDAALETVQNRLNALNATPLISTLLERTSFGVVRPAVHFGIALLHGGNKRCQDALLHYFHTHDEKFFLTIRTFLKSAQEEILSKRASGSREQLLTDEDVGALTFVEPLCRLLQLLAEGHHFDFQNYVRHQHDNFNSYNMCFLVMEVMHSVIKRFDPSALDIADQCLNTLTEFCQGPCPENQTAIVGCNVVTEVNRLLTMSCDEEFEAEEVMGLKSAAITTLLSLLEGSQDPTIPNLMMTTIDTNALEELLQTVWEQREDEAFLDLGFNIYILASVLITEGDKQRTKRLSDILKHCQGNNFFNSMVCSIEIWRDDDPNSQRLETVYFRKPEICKLREETRENVLNTVNRSSIISKHSDFFTVADDLIFEMEYQFAIEEFAASLPSWQNTFGLPKCRPRPFEDSLLGLGIVANFLVIGGFQTRDGASSNTAAVVFFLLSAAQFLCGVYLVAVRFVLRLPLLAHRASTERNVEDKFLTLTTFSEMVAAVVSYPSLYNVATEGYTVFFFSCAVVSLMSMFSSPFYSCYLLLVVMYKAPLLSNIVTAITTNGRQLLLTAFLGAIMVYFFSVVGYLFFHEHFNKDGETSNCQSLVECFFFSFGRGVRGGGGIGEEMTANEWTSPSYFLRETYDTLFFVVVGVIVMNIIFALIVDTFAELRDEKNKIEEDMATTCFICGIDAATFEREGERFKDHTHGPHNMWRYLYFMHHLRRKEVSEFTGQETYVFEKMRRRDLSFFPVNRSRSLEKTGAIVTEDAEEGDNNLKDVPTLAQIKQAMEEVLNAHNASSAGGRSKNEETGSPLVRNSSFGEAAALLGRARELGKKPPSPPAAAERRGSLPAAPPTAQTTAEGLDEVSLAPAFQEISDMRRQLAQVSRLLDAEERKLSN